jgi:peptidoglycan/xylan/chitin deacetylase (PgdA/CDA1 family)
VKISQDLERDFVGYGRHPPDPKWPHGARIAVNVVLNFEEGAELNVPDGDSHSEGTLTDSGGADQGMKVRDLAAESMFEYGGRVGFWRLYRMFRQRSLPLTIYGCALSLERNPEAAAAIREAGWDVVSHGWRFTKHYELDEAEERHQIAKAVESLTRTIGQRPAGWYCRYAPGLNTRRLLAEEGGFLYDSNSYADDLPYWVTVAGKPHLVVPHTFSHNDNRFARGWVGTAGEFFTYLKDAFDVLYRESEENPRFMTVSLHNRLSGHPARSQGIERFLDYVGAQNGVWLTSRLAVAKHWHEHHRPG